MTRPARILWTQIVEPPLRGPLAPTRRRGWRRLIITVLALSLGVAVLLAVLGRCDRAGALPLLDGQSATLLADDTWLVLGGEGPTGPTADGWLEDAAHGGRTPLPGVLRHARAGHTATLLPDGRVLIWGGRDAGGRPVARPEVFDPATHTTTEWAGQAPAPRVWHTTTLLPDGSLLVAGGIGPHGSLVSDVETWAWQREAVVRWPRGLPSPRYGHAAAISGAGQVWLSGGADPAGHPVSAHVRLDPDSGSASAEAAPPPPPLGPPSVARTWPPAGARGVSTDVAPALTVLPPLAPATVTADTVTLAGPSGLVPVHAIAAEGGRLLIVTPRVPLLPGADYTLVVEGLQDAHGSELARFALGFTTAAGDEGGPATVDSRPPTPGPTAASPSPGALGDPLIGPPVPDQDADHEPWAWQGPRQRGRPWSPWQDLPPHRAPAGVTALSGLVLDLAGQPLADVTLSIGQEITQTDVTGRFLLTLPEHAIAAGARAEPGELVVDGDSVRRPGRAYGRFEIGVALSPRQTTVLPYTIWLPALDLAHARTLPAGPLPADVVLTSPRLPGLEVHLSAGSRLVDHSGRPVTRVSLTPIPTDRPPFPLPPGVDTPVYFTLQPGGAYVADPAGMGARLVYPNFVDERRAPPGTRCAFWHYEPDEAGWRVYGEGEVGPGGDQIFPDPGVAVYEFTGAMLSVTGMVPPVLGPPPGGQAWAGDPVDLASGLFVFSTTDLFLPGLPTLSLTRTYRPEDPAIRPFGRGTTHGYALFLWSAQPYQEADLILPDGARVHYVRTSPGVGFGDAVFAHTGSPTPFSGSTLRWVNPTGGWDLTLRDGTVMHFGINAPLQWIRDRVGNAVILHRPGGAEMGPITRVSGSNGRWLALTYDAANRISEVQDSAGRTVRYTYDADHRLVAVTDPAGGITRYTYDAAHRMLTLTDARGLVFLRNAYDGAGRVVSQTLADGGIHAFAYAVNAEGRVTESRVTDPTGSVRRVILDASGYATSDTRAWGTSLTRTTTVEREPESHRITALVDALGRRATLAYDTAGNLTRLTLLDGTASPVVWTIAYEPRFSRPVSLTDPLGRVVTLVYDARGNLVALTDPTGRTVALTYDAEGQPLTITTPAGTTGYAWEHGDLVAVTDQLGRRWTRVMDAAGRPIALTDPLGRTTRLAWDPLNRLVERVDPAGGRVAFTYDANGNLLGATNARGHTTAYGYDAMDRRVTRTDALGAVTRYAYDVAGRLVEVIDRLDQVTAIAWDALQRPTALIDADGVMSTYTWDAADRLVRIEDTRSGPITRQYDALDRLVAEVAAGGAVQHGYDLVGQRVRLTPPGQSPIEYSYDGAGRLTALAHDGETVTLTLDPAGRPTRLTRPTGLITDITWDAASRVTRLAWRQGSTLLGELSQGYDVAGQPITQGGSWAATRLPAALGGAVYDAADRPLTVGPRTLAWDAEGRMIEIDDPVAGRTQYSWNARGQLIGVNGPSARLTFDHDGLDRRVETVDDGVATEWLHDGLTPMVERRQAAVHATRLIGPGLDQLWARTGPSGRRWPLGDMLGSPIAWASDNGTVVTRAAYGPFGEPSITGEAQPVAFTGREQDRPDLLHFRARPYVPSLQRFIAEDPVEEPGAHRYAYVGNAPLSGVDPLGLFTVIIHGGLPSSGPNGSSNQGGNPDLNALAHILAMAGEPAGIYNAGQLNQALGAARSACLAGRPVHLIGHSLGGSAVIDIAWHLAGSGIFVSDLTAIDAFHPRFSTAPPGVLAYNFFQLQHPPMGRPLGGRKANPLIDQFVPRLPGYAHLSITSDQRVSSTMLRMTIAHQVPCVVLR